MTYDSFVAKKPTSATEVWILESQVLTWLQRRPKRISMLMSALGR